VTQMVLRGSDFDAAQADFVPLSLRDINLHKSTVEWSDIGGVFRVFLSVLFVM
jgi:peroxin-1